ncbi:MAG: sarcosine oxidase subunit gamma, partial [Mesorhizobium sp.]
MAKTSAISSAATRSAALAGRNVGASGVAINVLAPAERISLRAPAVSIPALSKALGVPLPQKPKTSALSKGNGIFGP